MKTPDVIYLQTCGYCEHLTGDRKECKKCKFDEIEEEVTWCKYQIFVTDETYIRHTTIIAAVNRFLENARNDTEYKAIEKVLKRIKELNKR